MSRLIKWFLNKLFPKRKAVEGCKTYNDSNLEFLLRSYSFLETANKKFTNNSEDELNG